MTYVALGRSISPVEVTNISQHGFWLLLNDEELFLPFSEFPWFKDAAVGKIVHVELPSSNHLYWPDLDVDLAVESIRHPEQFPLVSRAGAQRTRIDRASPRSIRLLDEPARKRSPKPHCRLTAVPDKNNTFSGSRADRRSTISTPGEALFTPVFRHTHWRSFIHADLQAFGW